MPPSGPRLTAHDGQGLAKRADDQGLVIRGAGRKGLRDLKIRARDWPGVRMTTDWSQSALVGKLSHRSRNTGDQPAGIGQAHDATKIWPPYEVNRPMSV